MSTNSNDPRRVPDNRSHLPNARDTTPAPDWQRRGALDPAFLGDQAPLLPRPSGPRLSGCRTLLTFAAGGLFLFMCVALASILVTFVSALVSLPTADQLATAKLGQSTKIYDRNNSLLFEIFDPTSASGGRHTIIPPEKIPTVLKRATIATEDPSFYTNWGVDPYAVARAIYYDVRYGRAISGGSGITQQLIKNAVLTPEQTVQRKINEAILAVLITQRYSKDQIMAFYLNAIFYGNLSYGIEAASQSYFNKDIGQLDLAEASLLAGLPQAPALYDPCQDPGAALDRQKVVLELMQKQGFVSSTEADAALAEMDAKLHAPDFSQRCKAPITITAPHFVEYVRQQLESRYGPEVVYKGGLQVFTTLDPNIEKMAEEEVKKQVTSLKQNNVTDGALVAANPQTGEIYAMVGSADFFDKNIDGQVNVATSLRQPGSSIKPINYVTALQKGWTAATPIVDLSTQFPNGSQPPYVPINYDLKDHGIVSVRTALANSLNVPAVKTLYYVGVPNMIVTSQKMGINSFQDPKRYGLALTLGGGEVRLVELTGAYAVFANQGKCIIDQGNCAPLTPYRRIVDGKGNVVLDNEKNRPQPQQLFDPRYAFLITSILSDNNARAMEFGLNSPLKTSRPTFAKTGTTNDFKDNWTLGGTNELVVGVWVGNARNTAMKNVSGITGAAPIWHNVVERAYGEIDFLKRVPSHNFPVPNGLVQVTVCNESGLVATETCPADHRHTEIFLAEKAPKEPDNVWVKLKIDKSNNLLANDKCAPDTVEERVFAKMPHDMNDLVPYDRILSWAKAAGYPIAPTAASPCTNQPTPEPTPAVPPDQQIRILAPHDGERVRGAVQIIGTAAIPNLASYALEIGQNDRWGKIAEGDRPVVNGVLAIGDTRGVPDGRYTIRLLVSDRGGGLFQDQVQVIVDNQPDVPTPAPTKPPQPTATPPQPTATPPASAVGPGAYAYNDPAIVYSGSWKPGLASNRSNQSGATAALTFSGAKSVTVTTVGGPDGGKATVFIDGNAVDVIDDFSVTPNDNKVSKPYAVPDKGQHTITLRVNGDKRPVSTNTFVSFRSYTVNGGGPMTLLTPSFGQNDTAEWLITLSKRGVLS